MRSRIGGALLSVGAFVLFVGASAPAALAPGVVRNLNESGGGASAGGGSGGSLLSNVGPLLIVGLAIAVVVLIAAVVILLRTRSAVTPPASSEGWWTCATCGAGNLDGAPRCHACSTWRTTAPRPTPSTQP